MDFIYIYYALSFVLTFFAGYTLGRILEHDSQTQKLIDSFSKEKRP